MKLSPQQIESLAGSVIAIQKQLSLLTVDTVGSVALEISTRLDSIVKFMDSKNFSEKPGLALDVEPSRYDSMITAVVSIRKAIQAMTVDNFNTTSLTISGQLSPLIQTVVQFGNIEPVRADSNEVKDIKVPPVHAVATIESISPNPAKLEEMVTFVGSGFDPDGPIIGYEWSEGKEILSDKATWSSDKPMDAGTHPITFRVQDKNGGWSPSVQVDLEILEP